MYTQFLFLLTLKKIIFPHLQKKGTWFYWLICTEFVFTILGLDSPLIERK